MSQITKPSLALALVLLVFLGVLSMAGCGDSNSNSNYDPDSGQHPAGWLPWGHSLPARAHIDTCAQCHGTDFRGGISKVSCLQCHLGGPASVHPVEWNAHGPFTYALHGGYVDQHGTAACANQFCHGTNLQGVPGSGPSCTACHMGGPLSPHPVAWKNSISTLHGGFVLQNGTAGCRNATCHGAQLQGVFLSGPACNDCHNFATPIPNVPPALSARQLDEVRAKYQARPAQQQK